MLRPISGRKNRRRSCQIDTIPPAAAEAGVRKQIAEQNNVSESYVARSEKFMRGIEIMEQMVPGMQEKILSGQFKVRDADMHRLARADFPDRKQIVHEILHPEDRSASQSSCSHYSGINYSALEVASGASSRTLIFSPGFATVGRSKERAFEQKEKLWRRRALHHRKNRMDFTAI